MNLREQNIKELIDKYRVLEKKHRSELILVLVANVEGETIDFDDYQNTSVLAEYYTLDEFETLSATYKKLGYEVLSYFNENDFMSAILNTKIRTNGKKMFVINSAQTGTYIGRKSLIPAFCEHFKIMHTGSNPYVVSLCRNKFHSNIILNGYINSSLDTYLYDSNDGWIGDKQPPNGLKIIAKLNNESASIGLNQNNIFIYTADTDKYLQQISMQYFQPVIVQPFISGYEIELPVILGTEKFSLPSVGIKMDNNELLENKFLDYEARFHHTYDFYNYDQFSPNLSTKIKMDAMRAAQLLGIEEFGRIDFRIDQYGNYYISDIATNPHITIDSSYMFAFQELGYSYSEMLATRIGVSLSKYFTL